MRTNESLLKWRILESPINVRYMLDNLIRNEFYEFSDFSE